jgi:pantoate kinase
MQAFAPGSVTALFAPADTPTNSLGVSVAVADGVTASVEPADETRVRLDGEQTGFEPVERALDALDIAARVDLNAGIPVGCGFGASGAATLATALAANEAFDLGRSRDDLVETAAAAEVEAGTGLGDVYVQDRGGLVVGDSTGVRRFEPGDVVEYESYGGIDTSDVLGDDALMDRVRAEGESRIRGLAAEPSLRGVVAAGWAFARAIDVTTPRVEETVADVERAGGVASMAMVGESVFAVGVDAALAERTRVDADGARLV